MNTTTDLIQKQTLVAMVGGYREACALIRDAFGKLVDAEAKLKATFGEQYRFDLDSAIRNYHGNFNRLDGAIAGEGTLRSESEAA